MIIYKVGNLLEAPERYICHGCNAQGVMGSGVARQIREKWPSVYDAYIDCYKKIGLSLGEILWVDVGTKVIINAITQEFYGNDGKLYLSYEALDKCLTKINDNVSPGTRIAFPKIGAGLAGGDWNIISKIIEVNSTNMIPVVYVMSEKEIPNVD